MQFSHLIGTPPERWVGDFGRRGRLPRTLMWVSTAFEATHRERFYLQPKVLTFNSASVLAKRLRKQGKRIVFTNGVFDILHRGHVEYLEIAKSFGDVLIIGLNTDASVRRLKGPSRPIQKLSDRAAILLALRSVDFVVPFGEDTPERLIHAVAPDVLVKGADYRVHDIVGAEFVIANGGKVKRVRLTAGRSSSKIINKI